jgi:hypothetical protein
VVSPPAFQPEVMRKPASVGEVTDFTSSYFNAFSPYASEAGSSAEFRASYDFFSNYLSQVGSDYIDGVQAARMNFGLKGPAFSEPTQPMLARFDLQGVRGYGSPNLWGGMGNVINDGGAMLGGKVPGTQRSLPNTSRPRETPQMPLKMNPRAIAKTVVKSD